MIFVRRILFRDGPAAKVRGWSTGKSWLDPGVIFSG
jgi:hypothetical protein